MKIETIVVGAFDANCYVVQGKDRSALIIDPGADPQRILDYVDEEKCDVVACLLTHAHVDHISGVSVIVDAKKVPVVIHADDLKWAYAPMNQMLPFYSAPRRPHAATERTVRHLEVCQDAGLTYRVLHTPGHSPGSVCFHFQSEGVLFSGDTLFACSVGRTDLPGGNSEMLSESLMDLRKLPHDTKIYPGHGPSTILLTELQSNPFLA